MDGLRETLCRFCSQVDLLQVSVHLGKVVLHELVDDLGGQIDPDVQNTIFMFIFEGVLEVLFHICYDSLGPGEVEGVPLAVCEFIGGLPLLADGTVGQQVVKELNAEYFDFVDFFEN